MIGVQAQMERLLDGRTLEDVLREVPARRGVEFRD